MENDLVSRLYKRAKTPISIGWGNNDIFIEAANRIIKMDNVLRKIAAIDADDINVPKTEEGAYLWTVLAMCVELAENALEGKDER